MSSDKTIQTAMILDDEEFDQKLYRRVLERSGLVEKTLSFTYPDQALEFLIQPDRSPIDVLFLDINMPRMNGFEFLEAAIEQLGHDFAKIIVIMLTTSLNPADEERAKQYYVVRDFMNKPLQHKHVKHVCSLLDGHNALRARSAAEIVPSSR